MHLRWRRGRRGSETRVGDRYPKIHNRVLVGHNRVEGEGLVRRVKPALCPTNQCVLKLLWDGAYDMGVG